MQVRRKTVEHPFGTIKMWMGATHFCDEDSTEVSAEMSLHVLAYNLKRVMKIIGNGETLRVIEDLNPLYRRRICAKPASQTSADQRDAGRISTISSTSVGPQRIRNRIDQDPPNERFSHSLGQKRPLWISELTLDPTTTFNSQRVTSGSDTRFRSA